MATRHRRAAASVLAQAFVALADHVRDYAIFLMDTEGVITFWGAGAELTKRWTRKQAEGAHLRFLYPPGGSEDGTAEAHLRVATELGEYVGEGHRVRGDGSLFWAGTTITALRDGDGALVGFAKSTRDLTARRSAEALLVAAAQAAREAQATADAANAAKDNFLAMVSHEIRTPVNAVLGYHELLEMEIDGPLTAVQRQHVTRASAAGRHLVALIAEVLEFTALDSGPVILRRDVVDIAEVVSVALELLGDEARARGIELVDAVTGQVPPVTACAERSRVLQILVNLLANAVKFTPEHTHAAGRITVSAGTAVRPSPDAHTAATDAYTYIRIEDTGEGIAADRIEAIFEPFVQANMALTRQHGGTGLGLAISRRLARLMGGDVTARSEVGVGSAFLLWLPATPVQTRPNDAPERRIAAQWTTPPPESLTISSRGGGAFATSDPGTPLHTLADAMLVELPRVCHACVARLRSDPVTPSAHAVAEIELEEHVGRVLADLAAAVAGLDTEAGGVSGAVRDSMALQRLVAVRHGTRRAHLGWAEGEVRREFAVFKDELVAAVRRQWSARHRDLSPREFMEGATEALELLDQYLAIAERLSLESFRQGDAAAQTGRREATERAEPRPGLRA